MDLVEIRNRVMRIVHNRNVDDIDAEINMVQRQYIQPVALVPGEKLHTTQTANETIDLPGDAYRLNFIHDTTIADRGSNVPLLKDSDTNAYGARYHSGKLILLGIAAGRNLQIAYYRRLHDLGEGAGEVLTPGIPEQWHDLYWLGAVAMFDMDRFYILFQDRLREFKLDRINETRPYGARINPRRGWW